MGRPLSNNHFGDGAGRIICDAWLVGDGASAACHIVDQRSNTKYTVANEATVASTALVIGATYTIVTVSGANYTTVGSSSNAVGAKFTATGTTAGGTGTAREQQVCKLVLGEPLAAGEMQVEVTPELNAAAAEMQIDFGTTGGVVDEVSIVDAGSGYFTGGTFNITVASDGGYVAGTEAVIAYTVANQVVTSVSVQSGGSGYTADLVNTTNVNTADLPDAAAAGQEQSARIISARTVKTFEGNIYMWPSVGAGGIGAGATGTADRVRNEADLGTQ